MTWGVRVDCADSARVPRIPGLQESQGFTTPDLAHDDAIRPQPHGGFQQPQHRDSIGRAQDTAFLAAHWISDVSSIMTRRCAVETSGM